MIENTYPGISDRVKAMVIDNIVVIIMMFIAAYVFGLIDDSADNVRMMVFIFIVLLYDPLFTSIWGGTIGHMILGMRVKRESNEKKNILFPLAIVRYIVKALLGIISLFTVTGNEKRKAIHDHLVGSVIIYVDTQNASKNELS